MRTHPMLFLAIALMWAACDDTSSPPDDGTLVVSTTTGGNDPDHDGYLLTVDGVDSLVLDLTGTAEIDLPAGQHTLQLLGVADHCSVAPVNPVEVEVPPHSTVPVAFEISCPLTGARITTTTTGLDFDSDGYRLVVDGSDLRTIFANNTITLSRLDPGSRTIALTDLASNCAIDGPVSRTVTIVATEVAPIDFAVVCTATSGVIAVGILGGGVGAVFEASVDGAVPVRVFPHAHHLSEVPAGDHVVSLAGPANCSVETDRQSVTVTTGGLIRDTVEVTFSVACETAFWVTAPTTGTIPRAAYSVWLCWDIQDSCYWGPTDRLGPLAPNDTLIAEVRPGSYELYLEDLPVNCHVNGSNPRRDITIQDAQLRSITFSVVCS